MRVLVVGAGVIGQVYAGRLHAAGHEVTLLARGRMAEELAERGIRLAGGDRPSTHHVTVATEVHDDAGFETGFDVALLAVRSEQLGPALATARGARAARVATLCNLPVGAARLQADADADGRIILAFPGIGGRIGPDGTVFYAQVRQQPTTLAEVGGASTALANALRGAGFPVAIEPDMPAWLSTHAIFIAAASAAILLHGGDSAALGADRAATARMVRAIGEGFTALRRRGTRPRPGPLRAIFTTVPRVFAVPYWRRQLSGPVGVDTIAPHARATRDTELPAIAAQIRDLIGTQAPGLIALFTDAGLLPDAGRGAGC